MPPSEIHDLPRYMTVTEAAAYLGVSTSFLNKRRSAGLEPKFRKFGKAVRYKDTELDQFADDRKFSNTSQVDLARVA